MSDTSLIYPDRTYSKADGVEATDSGLRFSMRYFLLNAANPFSQAGVGRVTTGGELIDICSLIGSADREI